MHFGKAIPILYAENVARSLRYYVDVLGFESFWEWGSPPTFGGVNKNTVELFFCEQDQGHPGTWVSIFVDKIDELHDAIVAKGGKVLVPPVNREWNVREMLVEDLDGHKLRFGRHMDFERKHSTEKPATVKIVQRTPSFAEQKALAEAVEWNAGDEEGESERLNAPIFAVVAEDGDKVIGCALLLFDRASLYYVKNVIVHPDYQGRRVGSALMQEITDWLDEHAVENSVVALFTGENLTPFYQQFGFNPNFGMTKKLNTKPPPIAP